MIRSADHPMESDVKIVEVTVEFKASPNQQEYIPMAVETDQPKVIEGVSSINAKNVVIDI